MDRLMPNVEEKMGSRPVEGAVDPGYASSSE